MAYTGAIITGGGSKGPHAQRRVTHGSFSNLPQPESPKPSPRRPSPSVDLGKISASDRQPLLLKNKSRSAEDASHVGKKQKKPPFLLVTIEDDQESKASKTTLSSRSSLSERYEVSHISYRFLDVGMGGFECQF